MKSSANPLVGKKHADEQGQICESTGAGTSMASHRRRLIKKIDRAAPALTFRPVNPVVITITNCPSSPTTAGTGVPRHHGRRRLVENRLHDSPRHPILSSDWQTEASTSERSRLCPVPLGLADAYDEPRTSLVCRCGGHTHGRMTYARLKNRCEIRKP